MRSLKNIIADAGVEVLVPKMDLEAMAFLDEAVFSGFVDLFKELEGVKGRGKASIPIVKKITKRAMDEFGILVELTILRGPADAYVIIPQLDRDHPLYTMTKTANFDGTNYTKNKGKGKFDVPRMDGTLDPRNGRVSGVYSEIKFKISISEWFMVGDTASADKAAAVFLHEVGHAVSTCLFLGRYYSTNYVLANALRE